MIVIFERPKMKLKEYLVTIILPVYNASKYLPDCLESLTRQSYKNIQIIAIDDLSKDNSFKILETFRKKQGNMQIFQNKKHYGPAICYNRALKIAQGQFITFMNPNDKSAANRIKRQVQFLLANQKTVAVGTQVTKIDKNGKKLEKKELPQNHEHIYNSILHDTSIQPETVMINRMILPKDIIYFSGNQYPYLFTEIFIKLLQYGKFANTEESLYYQRNINPKTNNRPSKFTQLTSITRLWIKSRTNYDYRPNLRTVFTPIFKPASSLTR